MRLSDYVVAARAVVPLDATGLPAAARVLFECLVAAGAVQNPEALLERIVAERPEDIVAMGDRAFLLHYRTDAVKEMAVAIGTAREPICRELGESDRQCAQIVLLVAAPPRMAGRYLQLVGALARLLSKPETVEAVLAAPDESSLAALAAFRDAEMRVIGILSERDLLRHLLTNYLGDTGSAKTPLPTGRAVRDVMNRQVLCVSAEQPLAEVAALMANKEVDRVPVVRDGKLVGFLTRGDIVRKLIGS